jgi:glycosyltransferase involved in cell wall biosynthesis
VRRIAPANPMPTSRDIDGNRSAPMLPIVNRIGSDLPMSFMTNPPPLGSFGQKLAPGALAGLTIVLPCFDEAENLADAVRHATLVAERYAAEHEIVVVDDGSTDATLSVAGTLASHDPRVRLIVHSDNLGYAAALRTGIAAAREPWVLLIDADLQFDIGELAAFLPVAPTSDLVVGWRILAQGPIGRRLGGAVWSAITRAALDLPVRDPDCAFRLARRELLDQLDLHAGGALFGAELVAKSAAGGARVTEVPVHHRIRVAGRQDGSGARLSFGTLRELLGLRRARRERPALHLGV